ncbi:MAG: 3'(2'),5'-bisphosphate nucleotidase CysQ [Pseudomonadota bacterium]
MKSLVEQVVALCYEVGDELRRQQNSNLVVQRKGDATPVTEADLKAHDMLEAALPQLEGIPVLSEESQQVVARRRRSWSQFWLVDPLDGTFQYIRGKPDYTINVALVDGGQPVLGVVLAPAPGACGSAAVGTAAHSRRPLGAPEQSAVAPAPAPLRVALSGRRGGDREAQLLQALEPFAVVDRGGAIKSCLVAQGQADLYPRIGPTYEWDSAAAQCVVERAGGQLTDLNFAPLRYNQRDEVMNPDFLVFGDPAVADRVRRIIDAPGFPAATMAP